MNSEEYKEVKEKVEKLKRNIPYLENKVKSRNKKEIENSVAYLVYLLHRIHKKSTGKGTAESIKDLSNKIWWFKSQKKEDQADFVKVDKLYGNWAKKYDTTNNLIIFLEEKQIKNYLPNVRNKEILDFGCGTGRYSIPLAKKGANVTAIDLTKKMLNVANKKSRKEKLKINFSQEDITKYSSKKKFDLIISMLVLDHIKNLKNIVKVIDKSSKIGTEVIISNVHPEIMKQNFLEDTLNIRAALIQGVDTHRYYHSLSDYVETFLDKGFALSKIDNLNFKREYWNIKKFKTSLGIKGENLGIIMKFKKIK